MGNIPTSKESTLMLTPSILQKITQKHCNICNFSHVHWNNIIEIAQKEIAVINEPIIQQIGGHEAFNKIFASNEFSKFDEYIGAERTVVVKPKNTYTGCIAKIISNKLIHKYQWQIRQTVCHTNKKYININLFVCKQCNKYMPTCSECDCIIFGGLSHMYNHNEISLSYEDIISPYNSFLCGLCILKTEKFPEALEAMEVQYRTKIEKDLVQKFDDMTLMFMNDFCKKMLPNLMKDMYISLSQELIPAHVA